ncbi:MAG TPA: biliverdin-producing heme oxygenase [Segetibacter sp.]
MLSDRLKEETKSAHLEVEALIMPRVKGLNSPAAYADLLNIFYGYFSPVEKKIESYIEPDIIADAAERRKAAAILQDITFLGEQKQENECIKLPAIYNTATALGAMYVLEGSTLGGVHLSKIISGKMNFTANEGVEFFNGYGSGTLGKWNSFKDRLNNYAVNAELEDEVIKSANETFIKFKSWIQEN